MKITVVQTSPRFLQPDRNRNEIERIINPLRSDLIVFPELATSGYNFSSKQQLRKVSELSQAGPTSQLLKKWSRKKNVAIICGYAEKSRGRYFNSALFVTPRQVLNYRKRHLFFKEKKFFTKGNTPYPVHQWKKTKVGLMICFDWYFPEVMRALTLKGADVIAHPSNLVLPYALDGMKTRSLENGVYSATANRIGKEGKLKFRGGSQILGTRGEILAQIKKSKTGTISSVIHPAKARNKYLTPLNHIMKDQKL